MPLAALFLLAQDVPAPTLAERIDLRVEAGGGVAASSDLNPSSLAASGVVDVGLTTTERADGVGIHLGASAWGDTVGYAHATLGAGVISLSRAPSALRLEATALGGITSYPILGAGVIPMAGAEDSIAYRFGDPKIDLAATLGAAFVFPGGKGDVVDRQAITITSSDPVGYLFWGRCSATLLLGGHVGVGPFAAFSASRIGTDHLTTRSIVGSTLTDFGVVGGLQAVFAK